MCSGFLIKRFSICILLYAVMTSLFAGCDKPTPSPLMSGLHLNIIYRETQFMRGDNSTMTNGEIEYVFSNVGTMPVTMVFPPIRIVEFTSNTRRTLPEREWPDFAKKPGTLTLAPQEKRVFKSKFLVDTQNRIVPVLRFTFPNPTDADNEGRDYADCLTSEGEWDSSKTKEHATGGTTGGTGS